MDSDTIFSISCFFHASFSPKPLSIPYVPFQIFSKIHSYRRITCRSRDFNRYCSVLTATFDFNFSHCQKYHCTVICWQLCVFPSTKSQNACHAKIRIFPTTRSQNPCFPNDWKPNPCFCNNYKPKSVFLQRLEAKIRVFPTIRTKNPKIRVFPTTSS